MPKETPTDTSPAKLLFGKTTAAIPNMTVMMITL